MIYLIKNDNTYETLKNVIEWSEQYVVYKAGRGTCKIYSSENEYFTDQEPRNVKEES
jgi:hypothetical protein